MCEGNKILFRIEKVFREVKTKRPQAKDAPQKIADQFATKFFGEGYKNSVYRNFRTSAHLLEYGLKIRSLSY